MFSSITVLPIAYPATGTGKLRLKFFHGEARAGGGRGGQKVSVLWPRDVELRGQRRPWHCQPCGEGGGGGEGAAAFPRVGPPLYFRNDNASTEECTFVFCGLSSVFFLSLNILFFLFFRPAP
jgi:hypothetical protein